VYVPEPGASEVADAVLAAVEREAVVKVELAHQEIAL
jgi:hypothetical protein